MPEPQDFQAKLRALGEAFAQELPGRLADLEQAWRPGLPDAVQDTLRQAHRLAGAGATFGYPPITEGARNLEALLRELPQTQSLPPTSREALEITEALGSLRVTVLDALERKDRPALLLAAPHPVQDLVVFTGDDPESCQALMGHMENLGYELKVLAPFEALGPGLRGLRPAALVVVTDFPEGNPWTGGGLEELLAANRGAGGAKAGEEPAGVPPRLFVSTREDFPSRLAAVQAGGEAYFLQPVDTTALVSRLDALCGQSFGGPYEVVLAEEDPMVLEHHALVLESAGMRVARVQDPMQIMHAIGTLRPDLILLDWCMPDCTGPELASVLRQMESLVGVPLVFLSTEPGLGRPIAGLDRGGDDFLIKPIEPAPLVAAVVARAQRGRVLRSFMIRDSLTGIFNHTALKEQLNQDLGLAQRRLSPLSFAILDLDHFKRVNDIHGHPMGDRVLMNLTRLMQLRLRSTDVIGRYGGEEFGVILPDTSPGQAKQVLEDLLQAFGQLRFPAGSADAFHCTFSAGISAYPALGSGEELIVAADAALSRAKQSGRSRVILAD